ncbi:MAG: YihY/virulence factor BrkB family protein [Anaerolineae bacterium]|nr:YihY/virulence factor BrkB family protein [Anaerolineae bacterium]
MAQQKLLNILETIRARVYDLADRIDDFSAGFIGMVYRAADRFSGRGLREAAALSYYALFSLFPLFLLLFLVIGWLLGPAATQNQLENILAFFLPGQTAVELNRTLSRFVDEGASASLIALASLSWSALGLFSGLEAALSRTFGDEGARHMFRRRINGVLIIMLLGVLLLANIVTSLVFSILDFVFLDDGGIWLLSASIVVPFGLTMGIFAMLYRWMPRRKVTWDAIWPAALLGAIAWEAAKRLFGWYLNTVGDYSLVYGSIATVIIFMVWTYYTCSIILFFAEFCVGLAEWQEQQVQAHPERPAFAQNYYEEALKLPPLEFEPDSSAGGKSSSRL